KQDSREFGSINQSFFRKTFFCFRCLSLIGFPFFLGFYSKDFIVSLIITQYFRISSIFYATFCCIRASYSLRLIKIPFFHYNCSISLQSRSEDKNFFLPVIIIFLVRIFIGNFYIYYYLPINCLFFIDYFIGIIIIVLGLLLERKFTKNYKITFLVRNIFFLKQIFNQFNNINKSNYYLRRITIEDLNSVKALNLLNNFIMKIISKISIINIIPVIIFIPIIIFYSSITFYT